MPSTEDTRYAASERRLMLDAAHAAIRYGLDTGRPPTVDLGTCPESLRQPGAAFVTLTLDAALRGCIGSLEPHRPLLEDVAMNAWAAAFQDPRFLPLSASEFTQLDLHISILGPPQPLEFNAEQDLIAQLRPGKDGLIIRQGDRQATFLPAVWESLPEAHDFLQQLKLKAGISAPLQPGTSSAWRYRTEAFGEQD